MQYKSYKYRLYPTKEQEVLLAKTFGSCRYVYNRALALKMAAYQKDKTSLSIFRLIHEITKWKRDKETEWLKEVSSRALQQSLHGLNTAYTKFFKEKTGFPKFKSKFDNRQSFRNPQRTNVDWGNNRIFIDKFREGIKAVFDRKFEGKIKFSTIIRVPSGKYFISILTETESENPTPQKAKEKTTLGLDLGIKNYLTDSEGNITGNPRYLSKKLKLLKRAQRKLSRKKKSSKNRDKQRRKVAVLYEKVTNARKDFLHKLTRKLVENQDWDSFAIENLNVSKMLEKGKKNKLSRHIGDAGWRTFREFLTYKCERKGKNLLVIGEFEPSSKLCTCGYLNKELTLKDREWACPECKVHHDRDKLAARNIKRLAFCKQNTYNN